MYHRIVLRGIGQSESLREAKRLSKLLAIVMLLVATVAGSLTPMIASAAQVGKAVGNSYVTQRTGEKITWKSPWTFSDSISKITSDSELVALQNGSTGLLIGFLPGELSLEAARDEVLGSYSKNLDEFETLDHGANSNVSYSLDRATNQGTTLGIFTLFLGDTGHGASVLYSFLSPIDSFSAKMNSAKTKVAIGGAPLFEGVTPDGLASQLGGKPSSSASSSQSSASSSQSADQQDPRASYQEVDVRDLAIRTDNFKGKKVTVSGTVFNIQAEGNFTGIQIWVTAPDGSQEPVIIGYYGDSSGIYEGTYITVYGVCSGRVTGTNRLGGVISQPAIRADIIDH